MKNGLPEPPLRFYLLGTIPVVIALHFLKLRRQRLRLCRVYCSGAQVLKRRKRISRSNVLETAYCQSYKPCFYCLSLSVWRALRYIAPAPRSEKPSSLLTIRQVCRQPNSEKTRLELAKAAAKKARTRQKHNGDDYARITRHVYPTGVHNGSRKNCSHAIQNIRQTHIATNPRPAIDAAIRYADSPQDNVLFISDTFENLPDTPRHSRQQNPDREHSRECRYCAIQCGKNGRCIYRFLQPFRTGQIPQKTVDIRLEAEGKVSFDDKNADTSRRKERFRTLYELLRRV